MLDSNDYTALVMILDTHTQLAPAHGADAELHAVAQSQARACCTTCRCPPVLHHCLNIRPALPLAKQQAGITRQCLAWLIQSRPCRPKLISSTFADMLTANQSAHLEHIGHSVVIEHPGQQRVIKVRKVVLAEHDSCHFALGYAVSTPKLACRTLISEAATFSGSLKQLRRRAAGV